MRANDALDSSPPTGRFVMLSRVVAIALGLSLALFLFEVVWPVFDDDPASIMQTASFTGGLIVVAVLAFVYWSGP